MCAQHNILPQVCTHDYVFDTSSVKVPKSGLIERIRNKIVDKEEKIEIICAHLTALVHVVRVLFSFKEAIAQTYKLIKLGHLSITLFDCYWLVSNLTNISRWHLYLHWNQ